MRFASRITLALTAATLLAGCATNRETIPMGPEEPQPDLPPIQRVEGPLELRVSYPRDSAYVATRGENFIFGSTGHADARVWIDGREVDVQPNGGFLAFLPVPDDGTYELRATLGDQSETLRLPVSLPPAPTAPGAAAAPADGPSIMPGTIQPSGGWALRPGERVEVAFRGTPGGVAWLRFADGSTVPLVEEADREAGGATDFGVQPGGDSDAAADASAYSWYRGFFSARRITSADTTVYWPALSGEPRPSLPRDTLFELRELEAGAPEEAADGEAADEAADEDEPLEPPLGVPVAGAVTADAPGDGAAGAPPTGPAAGGARAGAIAGGGPAELFLAVDGDTARSPLPFNLALVDPARPRVGIGHDPDPPEENGDGHIIARPGPGGGPYHYVWRNGVELELTGERSGIYRVRLTDDLDAWTPSGDIVLRPAGTPPPTSRVATVRMDPQPGWVDVHVALDRRLPYHVEQQDSSYSLLVYGATSRANFLQHGRMDPYIERGEWSQPADRLFRLDIHLDGRPWGYETFWGEGDDLVLRLKRPPEIDEGDPLRGLTIGVDPGHGGEDRWTMGPTGYTEADANLGIALALRDALEREGARVVMTRTTDATVSLVERTTLAREEDVDVWISVHNNAFPDGVNPWENSGTSVYYNHPGSAGLAWSLQEELLQEMGLRDLGVGRADLHQPRFTWAPAVLTENLFMMIPEQEAFVKTEEGQQRIAEAHVRGLVEWLREQAGER